MRKQLSIEVRLRQSNTRLKNENKKLRERVKYLEEENKLLKSQVETLTLQVKELQIIIFGKKKNKDGGSNNSDSPSKKPRTKESFRRTVPRENEVTKEETYDIDTCPGCGSFLVRKKKVVRYIEDISLPYLNTPTGLICSPNKEITKQTFEKGYCNECKCWHIAKETGISPPTINNEVALGTGIKKYICYKTYILRLTYQQIQEELKDLYDIKISDGEIANILDATSQNKLKIPYEQLLQRVRKSSANHMDETSWNTKGEKTFAWVMAPVESKEAVFVVGKTRGKGVAEDLLGESWSGVKITDCYSAYKNLSGDHQVCWAHIIRKARDLAQNQTLEENKRKFADDIYHNLQKIYHELKVAIQKGIDKQNSLKSISNFKLKTMKVIKAVLRFANAPKKLTDLAKLMHKYLDELFTCLKYNNVPAENNKAEQKLRHLVLKRKNSFGTKTDKGNETFSINASVLLSLWWNDRSNFWPKFNELMGVSV